MVLRKISWRAKVQKIIPQEGNAFDIYFCFHGRGCLFKHYDFEIDIDFGPNGRYDGFDAYRLKKFMEFKKEQFLDLLNEKEFNRQFEALIREDIIYKFPTDSDDHLYYLKKNI